MLAIKIFEWHGVGQEAIVYTNNEVEEQTGYQFTCIEVLKCSYVQSER